MGCGCSKNKQDKKASVLPTEPECFVQVQIKEGGAKYWSHLTIDNFIFLKKRNSNIIVSYILPDGMTQEEMNDMINGVKKVVIDAEPIVNEPSYMIVVNEPEDNTIEDNEIIDSETIEPINEEINENIEKSIEEVEYISTDEVNETSKKTKKRKNNE